MAIATATITIKSRPQGGNDNTYSQQILTGTIAISTGGTYPPGGFPLNWSTFPEIKAIPPGNQFQSSTGTIMPVDMDVKSVANPPSGFIYAWDNVNGNLHIFVSDNSVSGNSGPLVEMGGAVPNTIVTDTIQFKAWFVRE